MPTPFERRRAELEEIDMYDALIPSIRDQYHGLLQKRQAYIDPRTTNPSVRRNMLNNNALIAGETNFSANTGTYSPLKTTLDFPVLEGATPSTKLRARIFKDNPSRVEWNPYTTDVSSDTLIAHETGGHSKQFLYEKRLNSTDWKPKFTKEFNEHLQRLSKQPNSLYNGSGFGNDPYETMAYFLGREAELPAGMSLKDDPLTQPIFDKFPNMYQEYLRSKAELSKID